MSHPHADHELVLAHCRLSRQGPIELSVCLTCRLVLSERQIGTPPPADPGAPPPRSEGE